MVRPRRTSPIRSLATALALLIPSQACQPCACGPGPEATLRTNLKTLRETVRQSCTDLHRCPERLEDLVGQGYLRKVPMDPIARSHTTWVLEYRQARGRREIVDVHSGARGRAKDGTRYSDW